MDTPVNQDCTVKDTGLKKKKKKKKNMQSQSGNLNIAVGQQHTT